MDAHYSKVMNAINAITDKGTRLYFAYSSVLDREAFLKWREEHSYQFFDLPQGKVVQAVDIDLVYDFNSRWWGGRVAGLVDKKGSGIYGVLFEIKVKDWPVVQHKEGVVSGACIEKTVRVIVDGKEVEATAFTTKPERATLEGPISSRYIDAWIRGAQKAGLPSDYIARLGK